MPKLPIFSILITYAILSLPTSAFPSNPNPTFRPVPPNAGTIPEAITSNNLNATTPTSPQGGVAHLYLYASKKCKGHGRQAIVDEGVCYPDVSRGMKIDFIDDYCVVLVMSTSKLSTLPPELICRIFQSLDDFSVVSALARTARLFYAIWRENPTSICEAVAARVIANYTDAMRLLDIQEAAVGMNHSKEDPKQRATRRAKSLISNARCASAATDSWINICQVHECFDRGEEHPQMRPSEIARFQHALYCVWAIGVMGTTPHMKDRATALLRACSPRELCRLEEFDRWATYFNENDFGSLGLDFNDEVWTTGCELVSTRWMAYQNGRHGLSIPDYTPFNFFAFYDTTQRYVDLHEGEGVKGGALEERSQN
ncbi:hypothetical protein EJ08DRAFT_696719 [Tothia fuscella]|uniref:F-box domain-containing protein n=1 Tax=Tothia fuscella TaxID=1048955 RepID=A0A9P4NSV0_9PEZI|nr:hypothetical protein EJ08DRAFT_696719 [Tothia fuscella]